MREFLRCNAGTGGSSMVHPRNYRANDISCIDGDENFIFWGWSSLFGTGVCLTTVGRMDLTLSLVKCCRKTVAVV